MSAPRTLFDKVWDAHVIAELGDGYQLCHVDRNLLHDLSGGQALAQLEQRGLTVHSPALNVAVPDHAVSSAPGRHAASTEISARLAPVFRQRAEAAGIRYFDVNDAEQGIVHVIGPELGLTLPGCLITCGDSHTPFSFISLSEGSSIRLPCSMHFTPFSTARRTPSGL